MRPRASVRRLPGEREEHVVEARLAERELGDADAAPTRARRAPRRAASLPSTRAGERLRVRAVVHAVAEHALQDAARASRELRRRRRAARAACCCRPTRLSSRLVPSAITRPWSITARRSARRSASSRYCVVSSTVVPPAAIARTMSHTWLRLRGSRPVVGSSRKSSSGVTTRLAAMSSRRRMPPEYVRTCFAGGVGEVERGEQLVRARRAPLPGVAEQAATRARGSRGR